MRHVSAPPLSFTVPDSKTRIGIVHSSFYPAEVLAMVEDAKRVLVAAGVASEMVSTHQVYGSFEIPLLGAALAKAKKVDALLGFGVIVEGDTHHAALLANTTAQGMMDIQVQYGLPFAFEILYVNTLQQATERAQGEQGKGTEAAYAVLQSLQTLKTIAS
jgi:6,7-dimethyl-8-ribityllumazine synthase